MATLGNLTAQGLYTSNHIGSVATDIGSSAFAMDGISRHDGISVYIQKLGLKIYKQSIRIIELENKMTKEECANLKAMLESNDEASVILAKEIIDNLETA